MSGHSKWSTIKRKKGAADAARGKIFTRLAREIQVAARDGADVESNFTLRLAVDRARTENMPKDNIERAIRRGAGLDKEGDVLEELTYEGYAPNGIAVLMSCLTDNRNRTISDVRRVLTRAGGNLGEPNSVAWQFTSRGLIVFNLQDDNGLALNLDPDEIFMAALDAGAEDVQVDEEVIEVYTAHVDLAAVAQRLQGEGYIPNEVELIMHPNLNVALGPDEAMTVLNVIENLEDLDDVTKVYHNLEMSDELVAQMA